LCSSRRSRKSEREAESQKPRAESRSAHQNLNLTPSWTVRIGRIDTT
jgi:hypothetical protein